MSEQDKPKAPPAAPKTAAAPPTAPKPAAPKPAAPKPAAPKPAAQPKAPPAPPKTAAGRAALEQYRANSADWDAIAGAAIKASGLAGYAVELDKLRARHRELAEAGHQVCDNVSALFAALARGEP